MSSLKTFLEELREEYKIQIKVNEQNIARLSRQIESADKNVKSIDDSIDYAYMALSSSQSANISENTEIDILNNIINERKDELEILKKDNERINTRFEELKSIILESEIKQDEPDYSDIVERLKFIVNIMDTDIHRAKTELNNLIDKVSMDRKGVQNAD